jgi:hypothetical protein
MSGLPGLGPRHSSSPTLANEPPVGSVPTTWNTASGPRSSRRPASRHNLAELWKVNRWVAASPAVTTLPSGSATATLVSSGSTVDSSGMYEAGGPTVQGAGGGDGVREGFAQVGVHRPTVRAPGARRNTGASADAPSGRDCV